MSSQPGNNGDRWCVGVDLGGTNVRVLARGPMDMEAELRGPHGGGEDAAAVAKLIRKMVHHLLPKSRLKQPPAVSAAVAAMLDPTGKMVLNAPNLGWRDVPFGILLEKELQVPVVLYNDLKAATYGELVEGAGKGAQDVLCVMVGSGVGSGFVLGGELQLGGGNASGELGHLKVVTDNGRPCGCGQSGCIEAYAGGHNMAQAAEQAAATGRSAFLQQRRVGPPERPLTPGDLEAGWMDGDETCRSLLEEAAGHLGLGLANAVTLLNPELLLLGGGVLTNCRAFRERTLSAFRKLCHPVALSRLAVGSTDLGDRAGLVGAVELARRRVTG